MITHAIEIESVHGIAELEHDEIGDVHYVADAGNAGGFEAVFEPLRRGLNFGAAQHASGVAAAELWGLDFDAYDIRSFRRSGFLCLWRNWFERKIVDSADFTRDAVVRKAVAAIRRDFGVDYGTVATILDACNVCAGECEARGEFLWRSLEVDR